MTAKRKPRFASLFPRTKAASLSLAAALFIAVGGIVGYLLLPQAEKITYAFTQESAPVQLNKLDSTPVAIRDTDTGFAAGLSDGVEVSYTPEAAATVPFMQVRSGENSLALGIVDAIKPTVEREDNIMTLRGIRPDTDLVYTHHQEYVKEDIVAATRQAAEGVTFFVPKSSGVDLERNKAGGIVGTVDGADLFYFHPPTATDVNGKTVAYEYILNERDDKYLLVLVPEDSGALEDAKFPLTIDPTISWSFTSAYTLSDPTKIEIAAGVLRLKNNSGVYATDNPYATTVNPVPYTTLSGFTEDLGTGNQGSVQYQLSKDNATWYWNDGDGWVTASGYAQSNPATTVNSTIAAFASQLGAGNLYVRAFLHAPSDMSPVELAQFTVTYTGPSAPAISSITPNSGPTTGGTDVTITGSNFVEGNATLFGAKTDYATSTGPVSIISGDFNGDDKLDLVTGSGGTANSVSVFLGNGTGTYGAGTSYATGTNPYVLTARDLNGDGNLDLIASNYGSSSISILLGTGTGTFNAKVDYATGANTRQSVVSDFNGDGKQDIAVASEAANSVSVFLGTGTGTFGAKTDFATGTGPREMTTGDWNGDNKPDLAVANSGAATVSILLGTGTGTFNAKVDYATGTSPAGMTTGDWNGDGKTDLAVTNYGAATVSVFLGTGTGTFGAKTDFATGTGPWSVKAADFNKDGKTDFAIANATSNTVSTLLGTGTGTFGAKTDFATGSTPYSLTTGDFNGDNRSDIAVANSGAATFSVLLNTFGAPLNVTFGGTPLTSIQLVNSTTITATAPAHALGAADVAVTNSDGQAATLTDGFTYLPPSITSVAPDSGTTAGGTNVTITGSNFAGSLGSGGTVTTSGAYTIHTFTSNGTFTVPTDRTVEVLTVAGGGGGGGQTNHGAGGGAGGLLYNASLPVTSGTYSVTVGAGGAGGTGSAQGSNGANSIFSTMTAAGGGGGGTEMGGIGRNGGSGGGGSGYANLTPGTGIAGQGFAGGSGSTGSPNYGSGGGGGAGGVGGNGTGGGGGNGGVGRAYSISGSSKFYAGGGGGSVQTGGTPTPGLGGNGGGGAGSTGNGVSGTPNTGGGGGGAERSAGGVTGGAGGSGIVIVKYLTPIDVTVGGNAVTNAQVTNSTTITATVPAHALGAADVVVTNGDGQTATLTGGFTYTEPPSITSLTPSSVPKIGGDTVTITGSNFVDGATVNVGGIPATGVTFVDVNTLSVVMPAQNVGTYAVVVTNPDGQTSTLAAGITFTEIPPSVSGVSPSGGSSEGGTAITITGTNFPAADSGGDTGWTTVAGKTLPTPLYTAQQAVIGDYVYLFGGYNGTSYLNTIYRAPVSDPTTWTIVAGKTLPGILTNASLAVVGDYLYLFGGFNGTAAAATIYRAPVSDPTTWTNTGKTLPAAGYGQQVAVVGNYVYLYGGQNAGMLSVIYRAPVSDPTTWTNTGKTLPTGLYASQVVTVGNTMYLLGGNNGAGYSGAIYQASTADPTTWTNTGKTLPIVHNWSQVAVIGDYIYLLGGQISGSVTSAIMRAPVSDPTTWTTMSGTLPAGIGVSHMAIIGDAIYLYGGQVGSGVANTIYRAPLQHSRGNLYNASWKTNWLADRTGVSIGGVAATNVKIVNATTMTATTAAHAPGAVDVVVSNSDGQSATLTNGFTYTLPPSGLSITPSSVLKTGGDTAIISGSNFVDGATVTFGGIPATSVTYIDASTLSVVMPAQNAGTYNIVVTNPGGQAGTLTNGITFLELPPTISNVTPNEGPTTGGTSVTISGANFYQLGNYRKPIVITNTNTETLTGYQVELTVNTAELIAAGKMRSDGGDIRFTEANGDTPLPYWVESGLNTAATKIWVKVPSIANGNTTINLSYGNASLSSQSNPTEVFELYDDFNDGVIDSAKWNTYPQNISLTETGGQLKISGTTNDASKWAFMGIGSKAAFNAPVAVDSTFSIVTQSVNAQKYWMGMFGFSNTVAAIYSNNNANKTVQYYNGSFWVNMGESTMDGLTFSNVKVSERYLADGSFRHYENGTLQASRTGVAGNQTVFLRYGPDAVSETFDVRYDNLKVRKTAAAEPASVVGSETPYGTAVSFGGTSGTNVQVLNSTTVTVTTPAHAVGATDVMVTNPDAQTATLSNGFTYMPPAVTLITPDSGPITGGTNVTITGSNFATGSTATFGAKADYPAGTNPYSVTTGDFNGDGKLDLATANITTSNFSVYLGTGTGTFGTKTDFAVGVNIYGITNGDFNKDGKLDIATANYTANTISVYLGTGTGTFGTKTDFAVGTNPWSVKTGDFNADGKLDLVTANIGGGTASVLLGTGTGTFGTKTDYTVGTGARRVAIGDFNGDNKLDLAVANYDTNNVSVLLGTGTGTFGAKADYPAGTGPQSVTAGDFNGDNKLDLAVANYGASTASVLLGTGTGTFGTKTDYPTGGGTVLVTAADFNGDAKLDLATTNATANSVSMLIGTGTGTFGTKTDFIVGANPVGMATGDYNADGKLDIATANYVGNNTSVLLNASLIPAVSFGGTSATNIQVVSPTTITAKTPAHAGGAANVIVTNSDGQTATLSNGFTYDEPPSVVSITPSSVIKTGGDTATVTGSNFVDGATVSFGGVSAASVTYVDANTLSVVMPAQNAGTYNIAVTNPDGQVGTLVNGATFTEPPPEPFSVAPNNGPIAGGTDVTITGTNFSPAQPGTGGTITTSNGYYVHTFTGSGVFTPPAGATNVQALVVGGGGQGGRNGGGGAGGLLYNPSLPITNQPYTVTVGAGGNAYASEQGGNGGNSSFSILTAIGGGGGAGRDAGVAGKSGGSGGGGGGAYGTPRLSPGSGTAGQGYAGGNGAGDFGCASAGGGGGGAGAVGKNAASGAAGNGGIGVLNAIAGSAIYYAGGGGGNMVCQGSGSNGIGGTGGGGTYGASSGAGAPNRGGGGAGGAGVGGSGVVIVKYLIPATVTFDGIPATNVRFIDSTTITATSPAHAAGAVDVAVTNADGATGTLAGGFTYKERPTVTSITPSTVLKTGGDTATITGAYFVDGATVAFGGIPATSVTYIDTNTLSVVLPAQNTGTYDVVVTNPDGQTGTLAGGMTFQELPPTISGITPGKGAPTGGTSVTITGGNYSAPATGGTITYTDAAGLNPRSSPEYPGGYTVHTFNANGTLTTPYALNAQVLVVAGGGGGANTGSGGGAGGYVYNASFGIEPGVHNLTVGAGGTGGVGAHAPGAKGTNSVFSTLTAVGGGEGYSHGNTSGGAGGSGGGGPIRTGAPAAPGGTGSQGNAGGVGAVQSGWVGNSGGGGGAGAVGSNGGNSPGTGKGGNGLMNAISGLPITYAGGGGGGEVYGDYGSVGGTGGGGNAPINSPGTNGTNGLGGGGGGGAYTGAYLSGGNGGSGVVIVRYRTPTPTVTFDGAAATDVTVVDANTITATTPPHATGTVDVTVTNPDGQSATLPAGFKYVVYKYAFLTPLQSLRETEPGTFVVQAQDQFGNPTVVSEDQTINLATSSNSGFFARDLTEDAATRWDYGSVVLPAGSSEATFYYKDNVKGQPTISLSSAADPETLGSDRQLDITSRYRLLVTGVTDPVRSGIPSSMTIQAVDYAGEPLNDYQGTVTFSSTDGAAFLPEDSEITQDMLGGKTFINGATMVTEGEWCVTVTDRDDPNITGSQCGITVTAPNEGTIAKLAFITAPQNFAATSQSGVITIQAQDATGAPIPASENTTLYIYSDSATGQLSADGLTGWTGSPLSVTLRAGTTAASFYYKDTTLGAHKLTVRDDAGTGADFGWIDATQTIGVGVGGPHRVKITSPAGPFTAGQGSEAFRVTLQDELGNEVPVFSPQTIWITGSGAIDLVSRSSDFEAHGVTRLPLVVPAGDTGADFYYRDDWTGNRTITASDSDPPNGDVGLIDDQVSLTVDGAAATQIAFATAPFESIAGATSGSVTVELRDSLGNRTNAQNDTTVYLYAQYPGAEFRSNDGATAISSVTIPSGASSASFKLKQTEFRAYQTITASDNATAPDDLAGLDDAAQTEVITAGSPSKIAITSPAPATSPVGTVIGPVKAVLQNQYSVAIPATAQTQFNMRTNSAGGTFALDASGPWSSTLSPPLEVGVSELEFYYRDTRAGTATVTVADESSGGDTGLTNATQAMTFTAGAAARLSITSASQSLQAGQASGAMTVRLEDQYGNPVTASSPVTVDLATSSAWGRFDTGAGGNFNGTVTSRSIAAGQQTATFYYKDYTAGTPMITASATGLTAGTQNQTIAWGPLTRIDLTGPTAAIAGQAAGAYAVVTYNAYNVNVPTAGAMTVNLTSNNGTGRFDTGAAGSFDGTVGSVAIPAGAYNTSFYYRATQASVHTLTAASGSMNDSQNVTVDAAAAHHLRITTNPQTLQLGQVSSPITVQVQDEYNNPTEAGTATTLNLSTTSATGQLRATSGGSAVASVSIAAASTATNFYYVDYDIGTPTITVAAVGYSDLTQTETIVAGAPTRLYFWADTTQLTAGQPKQASVFTANAYGVIIPATSDTAVTLTTNNGTGRFDTAAGGAFASNTLGVTIPNGQTNTSFYYRDTATGSVRITAARAGFSSGTYDFNINPDAPYRVSFTNTPRTTTAGNTSSSLTLTLYDAYGNVAPATAPVNVTVTDSESTARLSATGGNPWTTGSFVRSIGVGQSSVSFYYQDTVAGSKTITAEADGLVGSSQATTVNPAGFHHFGFATQPQTIVVQNPSGPFTVTGYDQYNNQRTMPAATLNLSSGSPQRSFSRTTTPWSPVTNMTITDGTYTATFYYKDGRLADTTVTATPTATYAAISQPVTITAGSVTNVRFTSVEQTAVTNTPSKPIDVRLADVNGYPAPAGTATTVTLSSNSIAGEFSENGIDGWTSTLDLVYEPGDTLKQVYFRDSAEGTVIMTAAAGGLVSGTQSITVIPGVIGRVGIVADSSATAGSVIPVTIETLTDGGLGAAVAANTTIQLTTTNGGQFSLSTTNWQPVTSVVIAAGQYQRSLFYRNTASGSDTLTARGPGASGWTDGQTIVDVGAGTYVKLAFLTLPMSVDAGAPSSQIVVQARDQYGNATLPAADQTLYLYGPAEGQFATTAEGPWDATSVVMGAGTGTATFYYNDATPGNKTLRVSDQTPLDSPDLGIQNAVGQIAVASLPPTQVRFISPERTVVAGERSQAITIEAQQANGDRAIVGTPLTISLSTTGLGGQFFASADAVNPVTAVTLPVGGSQVNVFYRAEKAGTVTLTAASAGLTGHQQSLTVTAAAGAKLAFISAPQSHVAGDESDQIILQLQDAFGNAAVSGQDILVDLTVDSLSGQFSLLTGSQWNAITDITLPADTSETALHYRDTTSGSWTIRAATEGLTDGTQTYAIAAGSAVRLQFATSPQDLVAGQSSAVATVRLSDVFGNAVATTSDLTVYLGSTSSDAVFSLADDFAITADTVTIPVGASVASFYFRDRTTGTPIITAADLALPDTPDLGLQNATQQQSVTAGSADHVAWTAPATAVSGQAVPVTVELRNLYDVPVAAASDVRMYLSTSGTGQFAANADMSNPFTEIVVPTGDESVSFYYRDTTAGQTALTARDTQSFDGEDVGILDATHQLMMLPESAARLRIISPAQNLEAGEASSQMTVQIQDIFGNAVSVPADTDVYVASSSTGGAFGATDTFAQNLTTVRMTAGASTASFYYRDATVGSPVIAIGDSALPESPDLGLANASQTATITAGSITKLGWVNVPATLEAGEVSATVRIETQNRFGIATPVSVDTTIYLEHTASGSGFGTSPAGPWTVTQVVIPAGQSGVDAYYRNQSAAQDVLTVSDTRPSLPDTGWANAIAGINVTPGTPTSLVLTNSARTTIARHPSLPYFVETRNMHGVAAPVTADTQIYLRSTTTSTAAEFSLNPAGPWGINYVTVPSGQSSAAFYYHDLVVGTPTITASDNLPVLPDIGLANTSQGTTIVKQTIDHFLVTNISTPQIQGTPSSLVVVAQDSDNYIIDDYDGTITFASSDADAVLPEPYTFDAGATGDQSIHTFINGVSFLHEGIKSVTVTDQNGITGAQDDIVVGANTAGPITGLNITGAVPPLTINADTTGGPLTVQAVDANGQPSNAPEGGYKVRLTSSSAGGEYALFPAGPWSSTLTATIPAHLSSINFYYRDAVVGSHTLTLTDWQADADDPGISNGSFAVAVRALQIDLSMALDVNNNSHYYTPSTLIYSKNSNGTFRARSDFTATVTDKTTGLSKAANLTFTWRSPGGTVLATQAVSNTTNYTYHLEPIDGLAAEGDYTLEVTAYDPVTGVTGRSTLPVPVSGWVARLDYDADNKVLGQPLPYTLRTYYNGVQQDPAMFSVNFRDDNGEDVDGAQYKQIIGGLTRNSVGSYSGTMPTTGLNASVEGFGSAYYLYARIFDSSTNQTLAEDNHFDIFFKNNPALASKNFAVEKVLTSTAPAPETYNLKFTWEAGEFATKYNLYRSRDKHATLYSDQCTLDQIRFGHRLGEAGATTPFCETAIQQNVGEDDASQWVKMGEAGALETELTVPWSQVQADLPGEVYYYLLRAENSQGESGYSTMAHTVRHVLNANTTIANINWISMPYISKYSKASDIVRDIEGSTGNGTNKIIDSITLWRPLSQDVTAYSYTSTLRRWTGVDFTLQPGDGISFNMSGTTPATTWLVAGADDRVTKAFNLNTNTANVNWISLPYSTKYTKASDIVRDLEGSLGNGSDRKLVSLSLWRPGSQDVSTYIYTAAVRRWSGVDFTLQPGDGVSLIVSEKSTGFDWTNPLIINPYK